MHQILTMPMTAGQPFHPGTPNIQRAAIYCRVSTESEMQEGSYDLQINHYQQWIREQKNMTLAGIYGDKGRTGRSVAARPAFRQLLVDCENGQIDLIITKSMSRFARNMAECIAVLRRLTALGIQVFFEKEGIESATQHGELLISIFAALAQEESNSLRQNVLWACEQHNASGKPHFKPSYGYTKQRGDWQWTIDERQASRVQTAFHLAAAGMCYADICRQLNAMETADGQCCTWTRRRLRYLLTNISYTGDCLTNKYIACSSSHRSVRKNNGEKPQYYIEGHHEPLISRDMFACVQRQVYSGALHSTCHPMRQGG